MPLRLDRLNIQTPIVDDKGRPTPQFQRFWQTEAVAIEGAVSDIESVNTDQTSQLSLIIQVMGGIDALKSRVDTAQATANTALAVGDISSGAAVSGSQTEQLSVGADWVEGPQVDLEGVIAGPLTIAGTGPFTVGTSVGLDTTIDFRVVEIVGGDETPVFNGQSQLSGTLAEMPNGDVIPFDYISPDPAVATFSAERSSTGSVSYRLDLKAGITLPSIGALLSVRRGGTGAVAPVTSVAGLGGDVSAADLKEALDVPADTEAALSSKQDADGDLTAIAALSATTGVLRKTAANTWALDTTTDHLPEGASSLYFTAARARASISATGSVSYNSATGEISYIAPTVVSAFTNDAGYTTAAAVAASYQPLSATLTTWAGKAAPSGAVVGATDAQTLSNKTFSGQTVLIEHPISSSDYCEVRARFAGVDNCQSAVRFFNPNNGFGGALAFYTQPESNGAALVERLRIKETGVLNVTSAPTYADNAAATSGGLTVGDIYKTASGELRIVV